MPADAAGDEVAIETSGGVLKSTYPYLRSSGESKTGMAASGTLIPTAITGDKLLQVCKISIYATTLSCTQSQKRV